MGSVFHRKNKNIEMLFKKILLAGDQRNYYF